MIKLLHYWNLDWKTGIYANLIIDNDLQIDLRVVMLSWMNLTGNVQMIKPNKLFVTLKCCTGYKIIPTSINLDL